MKSFVIFSPDQVQNSNCFDDLIEILMALLEHDKNYVDSDKALKEWELLKYIVNSSHHREWSMSQFMSSFLNKVRDVYPNLALL